MLQIQQSVSISRLGKRTNNEDCVYPFLPNNGLNEELIRQVPEIKHLYMVCDGVGGANKGEVASQLACITLPKYFEQHTPDKHSFLTDTFLEGAVAYIEQTFDQYVEQNPDSRGMGTTFTMFYANDAGINLAWAGDSRIYHFRKGLKLYQSEDHSLVNYLVKLGQITTDEARTHKQKNVILRALQGTHAPTKADLHTIGWDKIEPNDYFLLCSDGLLEGVDSYELERLMGLGLDAQSLVHELESLCDIHSKDNFSCYLLQMGERISAFHSENEYNNGGNFASTSDLTDDNEEETIVLSSAIESNITLPQTHTPTTLLQRLQSESVSHVDLNKEINEVLEPATKPVLATVETGLQQKVFVGDDAIDIVKTEKEKSSNMSFWLLMLVFLAVAGGVVYWYSFLRKPPENIVYTQAMHEANELYSQGRLDDALAFAEKARDNQNITEAEANAATAFIQKINDQKSALRDSMQNPYNRTKIGPGTPYEVTPTPSPTAPKAEPATKNMNDIKDQNKPIIEKPQPDTRPKVIVERTDDSGLAKNEEATKPDNDASSIKRGMSSSQMLKEAKTAYTKAKSKEDYQAVQNTLEGLGDKIDGEGAYVLSYIYNQGFTGKVDAAKGAKYAAKSAEKGWSAGQYYQGYLLLKNKTNKDTTTARQLLSQAANKGNSEAKTLLDKLPKPSKIPTTAAPKSPTKPAPKTPKKDPNDI